MKTILCFLLCLFTLSGFGQSSTVNVGISMPSVALMDIEPTGSVSLNLSSPTEAGRIVGNTAANNSKWINISSAVSSGQTRKISAQISGTQPGGLGLRLSIAAVAGGAGARGTPEPPLILSTSAQKIIDGIGGGYTNSGSLSGFNLTYSLTVQNYNLIKSGSYSFSVLYTLADN